MRTFRHSAIALVTLGCVFLPGPVRAQIGAGPVEIGDLELARLLDPKVAAVSLHEEEGSIAPASVFVLTRDDLRAHGFRTLAEALRSVPGLFTYSDGFYQYVGFRGVGLLVDYTVRTLVLVDGHPINNSLGQAENSFGLDLLVPLAMVERIEVIKGPVGSVYGPAAFLGAINIVTWGGQAPHLELATGTLLAQGRSVASDVTAVASGRLGGVSLSAGAEGTWTPGYTWSFPELAQANDRPAPPGGRVAGMDFGDAQKGYLRATWEGLSFQAGCGHWFRGLASAPYSTIIGDRRNREESLACFGQVGVERPVGTDLVLSGRLAHDFFSYRDLLAYDLPSGGGVGPFRDLGRDSWLSANVQARWQAAPGLLAIAGVTGDRHTTRLEAFAEMLPTLAADPVNGLGVGPIRTDYFTVNGYVLAEWQVVPALALHGGLTAYRHEVFGSRLTPRVAAVWRASPRDTVKLLYTEGFRAPSASEAFFNDALDYIPNLGLKPETAREGEVTWERRFGSTASVTVSAFAASYGGLIRVETVPRPGLAGIPDPANPGDFRQQARNGGSFSVRGLDLGGRLRLGRAAQAYGGVSLQQRVGDEPPNSPPLTANLALATSVLKPLSLALRGYLVGPRNKDTAALLPGQRSTVGTQVRLDATAILEVPWAAGLSFEARVLNVLDQAVLHPVANDFAPISQMSEPPLTVGVSVRYQR